MNYYIKGSTARADEIKAAFEKLGYDTTGCKFNVEGRFYYTHDGRINLACGDFLINFIKTHPDYKELELPVKPKFKVGDWLVYKYGNCFAGSFMEAQVVKVKDGVYYFSTGSTGSCKFIDDTCRLWSIADAKDGDVLTNGTIILIVDHFGTFENRPIIYSWYFVASNKFYGVGPSEPDRWEVEGFHPATKEQRDLLFAKMKEAGYEWDANKKELRKIKPHYDISNFKPFQKVLVRDADDGKWMAAFYSHYMYEEKGYPYQFATIGTDIYAQCIPFEGNEHLFRTTDMCDERFINW
jgi:hypothetical protein